MNYVTLVKRSRNDISECGFGFGQPLQLPYSPVKQFQTCPSNLQILKQSNPQFLNFPNGILFAFPYLDLLITLPIQQ
jgi:hypothetical protein